MKTKVKNLTRGQIRTLLKLQSTYIEPYLETYENTMHTSFCNWGTLTGRLSSREPNLQNIPRNHFKLTNMDFLVIGNIIPGLIANWMDRQGVLRTIFTVLITAGVTKLFIMTLSVYQIINIQ